MVKVKKVQNLPLVDLFKVFFSFRVFENKNISKGLIFIYSLIFLVINSIISVLINHIPNFSVQSDLSRIGLVIFGFPAVILITYLAFYIVLNALEDNRKSFIESYLVFLAILLPFFTIGNLVNYIGQLFLFFDTLIMVISNIGFYLLLAIYFTFMLAGNFKFYYGTSIYRIVTSYFIVHAFFFAIFLPLVLPV